MCTGCYTCVETEASIALSNHGRLLHKSMKSQNRPFSHPKLALIFKVVFVCVCVYEGCVYEGCGGPSECESDGDREYVCSSVCVRVCACALVYVFVCKEDREHVYVSKMRTESVCMSKRARQC